MADIIRESVDGATMYELMAAYEGWPETSFHEALEAGRVVTGMQWGRRGRRRDHLYL
jgi:hypothetical protein